MPYIIQHVHGSTPPLVGEQSWGEGAEIQFGAMTSCIALVEQNPDVADSIRAIHLSLLSPDNTPVYDPDSNVLGQIVGIMQLHGNLRACLGRIDFWQSSESIEVQDFFSALIEQLQIDTGAQLPDGSLGVRWHSETIQYAQEDSGWLDVPY